jgi:hypothetical protein
MLASRRKEPPPSSHPFNRVRDIALKLRFVNDVERCPNCGAGELKIIAAILERPVIEKILSHLGLDPQPARRCARQGLRCWHTASGPV